MNLTDVFERVKNFNFFATLFFLLIKGYGMLFSRYQYTQIDVKYGLPNEEVRYCIDIRHKGIDWYDSVCLRSNHKVMRNFSVYDLKNNAIEGYNKRNYKKKKSEMYSRLVVPPGKWLEIKCLIPETLSAQRINFYCNGKKFEFIPESDMVGERDSTFLGAKTTIKSLYLGIFD